MPNLIVYIARARKGSPGRLLSHTLSPWANAWPPPYSYSRCALSCCCCSLNGLVLCWTCWKRVAFPPHISRASLFSPLLVHDFKSLVRFIGCSAKLHASPYLGLDFIPGNPFHQGADYNPSMFRDPAAVVHRNPSQLLLLDHARSQILIHGQNLVLDLFLLSIPSNFCICISDTSSS